MGKLDVFLGRLTRGVEIMAGLCLAMVTILIFASAIGRYLFAYPIPDSFDIARLLLGVTVIWGFAVLGFSGQHISVDLVAEALPPRARRVVEIIAQIVLLAFSILLTWKVFSRTAGALASNEATFDLRLPVWPFMGLIWLGTLAAVAMALLRLIILVPGSRDITTSLKETLHD